MVGKNVDRSDVEKEPNQVEDIANSSKTEMSEWEKRLEAKK